MSLRNSGMCPAVASVGAALMAGCGTPSHSAGPPPPMPSKLPATGALRSVAVQANRLLDGGSRAFRARLASLRRYPVVVNQWASWCGPCRFEFPFFQRLAAKYSGRVAFLGVDSKDARGDAAKFLKQLPVPYPHYFDPDTSIARVFHGGLAWPTTAFYTRGGKLNFIHQGAYATQAKLENDIQRYAIRG